MPASQAGRRRFESGRPLLEHDTRPSIARASAPCAPGLSCLDFRGCGLSSCPSARRCQQELPDLPGTAAGTAILAAHPSAASPDRRVKDGETTDGIPRPWTCPIASLTPSTPTALALAGAPLSWRVPQLGARATNESRRSPVSMHEGSLVSIFPNVAARSRFRRHASSLYRIELTSLANASPATRRTGPLPRGSHPFAS